MRLLKSQFLLYYFPIFISCSCEDRTDSPYLEKDYNYIVGILVPDSLRTYRQEIFVGKMLDIEVSSSKVDTTHYGEDPILYIQNLVTWHDYRGKIIGSSGAQVFVTDENNNKVQLEEIDNGIYRDVNGNLIVKPLKKYFLEVTLGKDTFKAETTIPGNFNITNIIEDDTASLSLILKEYGGHLYFSGDLLIYWSSSVNTFYYRTRRWTSLFSPIPKFLYAPPTFIAMTIDTSDYIYNFTINASIVVDAYDTNYGRMYSPDESCTAPLDLLTYLSDQETRSLPERTNIKGNNVVGVFGSLNRTMVNNFFIKGVKNSAVIKKNNK